VRVLGIAFLAFVTLEFGLVSFYVYSALRRAQRPLRECWAEVGKFWLWVLVAVGMLWWCGWYCDYDILTLAGAQFVPFAVGLAVAVFAIVQVFKLVNRASRIAGLKK
jgi:hypothetical protein